jgi:WD40 repeat protein
MLNRSGELRAVLPHARLVNGAVFEPDGDRVATASMDGTAAVWSDSGERLHVLDHGPAGHDAEIGWIDPESSGAVFWASWSPDGGRFATGCADRRLRFWDADDGQLRGPPIDGHQGPPLAFAWSSDGALLATAEGDAELDLGLGPALVLVHRSDPPFARIARLELPAAVFGLAFHPDGHLLATACADGRVRVHSLPDGEPVVTHDLGGKAVEVSWSRRGDRLLASSTGGAAAIWRPDGALLRRRLFEAGVWLRFAGDDHIFGHGPGRAVLLLDDELRERFVGQGHSQRVCGVALAGDASCIVSVAEDRTARVWQVQDPELPSAHAHDSRIAALSPSPDAGVVSVGEDGTVAVCDAGGRPLRRLPIARRAIVGAVLDPVGGRLAVVGYDSRVDALDLVTGRPLGEFVPPGLRGRGGGAAWLGSDRLAVGGAGPLDIHVYEVPRGRSETWSKSTGGMIRAMASAPRRQLLFAAGWNGRIACWGWDGTLRAEPPTGQATWFDTLAVSPDEKWLAAGGGDRRVYVFRVGPGEEVLVPLPGSPFLAHDASVQALAFSPDGRWFATAAEDGSVHLWSMATWTVTTRLRAGDRRGLRSGEVGLAFSADSTRLWTAGGGGAIRTFACDPDELVRLAHERLAQIRGGCPPIRRYLDLHDRDDTASAFAVAERIIATASRVGDRRTLHAFAARLIGLEDGGPVELNLARRAVDQALDGLADPPPRWLGTLARWHAARGDYPAAVEVQRRAVALRPLPELLAALADYERRAVAGR